MTITGRGLRALGWAMLAGLMAGSAVGQDSQPWGRLETELDRTYIVACTLGSDIEIVEFRRSEANAVNEERGTGEGLGAWARADIRYGGGWGKGWVVVEKRSDILRISALDGRGIRTVRGEIDGREVRGRCKDLKEPFTALAARLYPEDEGERAKTWAIDNNWMPPSEIDRLTLYTMKIEVELAQCVLANAQGEYFLPTIPDP